MIYLAILKNKVRQNKILYIQNLTLCICLAITLILYNFFSFRYINVDIMKLINMVISLGLLLITLPLSISSRKYYNKYTNFIRGVLFLTILSIFSSWMFWEQSIVLGFRVTYVSFCIGFFFLLVYYQIPLSVIEKYVIIVGIAYCLAWLLGFVTLPNSIFGSFRGEDEGVINDSRGLVRMMITGKTSVVLAYFLSLTKFSYGGGKKFLVLGGLFFTFIVLMVTRQIIIFSFLISMLFLFRNNKGRYIIVLIVLIGYSLIDRINKLPVLKALTELTESQIIDNRTEENVRIKEYKYFFTDYSQNTLSKIIGNGYPHLESKFGKRYKKIQKDKRYFLSDVGYARMYADLGLVGLLLYLAIFIKTSLTKCDKNYMFARLFMIYMLFANIGADWYAKIDGILAICVCTYLLGRSNKNVLLKSLKLK